MNDNQRGREELQLEAKIFQDLFSTQEREDIFKILESYPQLHCKALEGEFNEDDFHKLEEIFQKLKDRFNSDQDIVQQKDQKAIMFFANYLTFSRFRNESKFPIDAVIHEKYRPYGTNQEDKALINVTILRVQCCL
jgi:hypothetical protein